MKHVLRFFFASIALSTSVCFAAKPVTSFGDLVKALESGKRVRVVAEYAKMKLFDAEGKEEESVDATGGTEIDAWERFGPSLSRDKKAWISTSHTVLISHRAYGYVQNYVRFRFVEDGSVEITARYLKPQTLEVVMDETFKGKISNGKDKEGIHLYVD